MKNMVYAYLCMLENVIKISLIFTPKVQCVFFSDHKTKCDPKHSLKPSCKYVERIPTHFPNQETKPNAIFRRREDLNTLLIFYSTGSVQTAFHVVGKCFKETCLGSQCLKKSMDFT